MSSRVCAALLLLVGWATVAGAEGGLGVLPPREVKCDISIPREGLWRAKEGAFVLLDTVRVTGRKHAPRVFTVTDEEPGPGQFRPRRDGALRFARGDAGKRISISYQYAPRRLAVLPPVHGSDYRDVVPVLEETLTKELSQRGLVLVPPDRVVDALAEVGLRWPAPLPAQASGKLAELARRLDAAYLLLPAVSASREVLFAGIQTIRPTGHIGTLSGTIVASGNAATAGGPSNESSGSNRLPVPVEAYRSGQSAAVGLLVVEGQTGHFVAAPAGAGHKRIWLRIGNKKARRALVRALAADAVAQWREGG